MVEFESFKECCEFLLKNPKYIPTVIDYLEEKGIRHIIPQQRNETDYKYALERLLDIIEFSHKNYGLLHERVELAVELQQVDTFRTEKAKAEAPESLNIVYMTWTEYERGWGQRPDGVSFHLTTDDFNNYIEDTYKGRGNVAPAEYSNPDSKEPKVATTRIKALINLVCVDKSARRWQNEQLYKAFRLEQEPKYRKWMLKNNPEDYEILTSLYNLNI